MMRRRLFVLSIFALPAVPAAAQPYWGNPRERQLEYERHREDEWRRRAEAQRREQWQEQRERAMWERRRREELRRDYDPRRRPGGDR